MLSSAANIKSVGKKSDIIGLQGFTDGQFVLKLNLND
jgi:hypothetical protein